MFGTSVGAAAALSTVMLAADAPKGYVIRDVSIVDVTAGIVHEGQFVYVQGHRISDIAPVFVDSPRDGLQVIDGSGLYLMPGLWDAHVHLLPSVETFGPLLLAHGVTAVRDTGAPTAVIVGMRNAAASAGSTMPTIVCTGAIIDGDPPIWPFSHPCDEPEEARAAVRLLAEAGVDQIKVYSLLEPEVYEAAVEQAHTLGLKAIGHVPHTLSIEDAIEAGQDGVEHLTGFDMSIGRLAGWSPEDPEAPWAWFQAWPELERVSRADLRALAKRVAEAGMHQCPTLVVMQGIGQAGDPEQAMADPRMAYVPPSVAGFWVGARYERMSQGARRNLPFMKTFVGELYRAGVPLMIGTDLANPFVFAGSAVHEEMLMFQEAGVPAVDVLRAATIVPARFCGADDTLGAIAEGKVASMVLVGGNPLDDIRNASRIDGVFLRGRYYDRKALDRMLENVKATVARSVPIEVMADLELPGELVERGRYRMKFQAFDAGTEDFVITRDDDGWHVKVHSQPQGSPQPPYRLSWHAKPDFSFQSAEYEVLRGPRVVATYTREGNTLRAVAQPADGGEPETQEMQLPENALITSPAYAPDFLVTVGAALGVGESRTFRAIGFGFQGWRLSATDYTLTRRPDTTLERAGADVPVRHYTFTLSTQPFGTISSRLEETGLSAP